MWQSSNGLILTHAGLWSVPLLIHFGTRVRYQEQGGGGNMVLKQFSGNTMANIGSVLGRELVCGSQTTPV